MMSIDNNPRELNVCTWNVENFISVNDNALSNTPLSVLKEQDIILLQETQLTTDINANNRHYLALSKNLTRFLEMLNDGDNNKKYKASEINRVAVVYNSVLFESAKTIPINLAHEPPKGFEKTYTTGSQVTNMLTILYPNTRSLITEDVEIELSPEKSEVSNKSKRTPTKTKDTSTFPICVVNFHLNAYSPELHKGFHTKQLTGLLKNAINHIKQDESINKFGLIIGGDTNYRTTGKTSHLLLEDLLPCAKINGVKLIDACEKVCKREPTQSFQCVHEKGTAKKLIKLLSPVANKYSRKYSLKKANARSLAKTIRRLLTRTKKDSPPHEDYHHYPRSAAEDNRLDFIASNLKINYDKTRVVPVCEFSDHYMVLSKIKWEIDDTPSHQSVRSACSNKSPSKKQNKRWFRFPSKPKTTKSRARIHPRSSPSPKFSSL
jgi:hypothetical protein